MSEISGDGIGCENAWGEVEIASEDGSVEDVSNTDPVFRGITPEVCREMGRMKQIRALVDTRPELLGLAHVIYCGSASDASFADVLGKQMVHVDPDQDALRLLEAEGYKIAPQEIEEYVGGHSDPIDLFVSYNSGTVSEEEIVAIREGGFVLANNWHDSANMLSRDPRFRAICAVSQKGSILELSDAEAKLGYMEIAILPGGSVIFDQAKISALKPGGATILEEPVNTETIWLFQKKTNSEPAPENNR